jgi:hypothetical protein
VKARPLSLPAIVAFFTPFFASKMRTFVAKPSFFMVR